MVIPARRHVLRVGHDLRFRTTIKWVRLRSEGKFALRMRLAIWCASSFNNRCPVLCIAVRCQKVQRQRGGVEGIRASNSVVFTSSLSFSLFLAPFPPLFFNICLSSSFLCLFVYFRLPSFLTYFLHVFLSCFFHSFQN